MDRIIAVIEKIGNRFDVPFQFVIFILVSTLILIIILPIHRKMFRNYIESKMIKNTRIEHTEYIIKKHPVKYDEDIETIDMFLWRLCFTRTDEVNEYINSIKMLKFEQQKVADNTLRRFGFKKQTMKTIEELSELNVELTKYCNSIGLEYLEKSADKIINELADVYICLFQVCIIVGEMDMNVVNGMPLIDKIGNAILTKNIYEEKKTFQNTISHKEMNDIVSEILTLGLYLTVYYQFIEEGNNVKNNSVMIIKPLVDIYKTLETLTEFFGKEAVLQEIDFKIKRQEERNEKGD